MLESVDVFGISRLRVFYSSELIKRLEFSPNLRSLFTPTPV